MPNSLISRITLPNGSGTLTTYDIKDAWARQQIQDLGAPMHFKGVTTTQLTDGSTTNPITIGGSSYHAVTGDVVIYSNYEFVWDGAQWNEFSNLSHLSVANNTSGISVVTGYSTESGHSGATTAALGTGTTLTGTVSGTSSKLVTTSIKGVAGTDTVHDTPTLNTTTYEVAEITPVSGTTSASSVSHISKKLVTTSIKGVAGTDTVHDTPTLDTTTFPVQSITPAVSGTSVGSASGWSAGTLPTLTTTSSSPTFSVPTDASKVTPGTTQTITSSTLTTWGDYDSTNEALTLVVATVGTPTTQGYAFSQGTSPSLTVTSTPVATAGTAVNAIVRPSGSSASEFALGTSLTAGSSKTFATAASTNTTVATGSLAATSVTTNVGDTIVETVTESSITVPTAGTSIYVIKAPSSADVALGTSLTQGSPKTFATANENATTVATGSLDSDGAGASVLTGVSSTLGIDTTHTVNAYTTLPDLTTTEVASKTHNHQITYSN